jgi:hypothetical protein
VEGCQDNPRCYDRFDLAVPTLEWLEECTAWAATGFPDSVRLTPKFNKCRDEPVRQDDLSRLGMASQSSENFELPETFARTGNHWLRLAFVIAARGAAGR